MCEKDSGLELKCTKQNGRLEITVLGVYSHFRYTSSSTLKVQPTLVALLVPIISWEQHIFDSDFSEN